MRTMLWTTASLLIVASSVSAQQVPTSGKEPMSHDQHMTGSNMASMRMTPRAAVLEDIERSRQNLLKYLAIAPDSMLTYRIHSGVRTYAEQLEHAAGATAMISAMALKSPRASLPADSAAYRRNKPALQAYINAAYDAFASQVRNATDAQLLAESTMFGMTKPGWRWVAGALEHATWTLGQVVPYLRANGVTPPLYLPF